MTTRQDSVADNETLARYIYYRRYTRQDGSVRPDAFMPAPDRSLSVSRHRGLSEPQLWDCGKQAGGDQRTLVGRADLVARSVRSIGLSVRPDEPPPNHALIEGWPVAKEHIKERALDLAREARYFSAPTP